MRKNVQYGIMIVTLIVIALLIFKLEKDYGFIFGKQRPCPPLSLNADANGDYIPPANLTCVDGVWVPTNPVDNYTKTFCEDQGTLTTITWDGLWDISRQIGQGEEYCFGGEMFTVPYTCGGPLYECNENENAQSCWVDCGPIQDWSLFHLVVESRPELQTYLESEYEFEWQNPIISEAIAEIENYYNPDTPFDFVKAATTYIKNHMDYVFNGVVQCGEKASTSLERGTGNCVDYSTNLVTILRAKGIPARQVCGCVSNYNWKCTPFEALQFDIDLRGVQGHAWVEVWVGDERGWVQADPTTGVALTRSCVGYHKIEDTSEGNLCWISDPAHISFCDTF